MSPAADSPEHRDPLLDPGEWELLMRVLRERPEGDAELEALVSESISPEPAIARLLDLGYLARHADGIAIVPPLNAIVDRAARALRDEVDRLGELITSIEQVPSLTSVWESGLGHATATLRGEHVTGRSAVLRHWFDLSTRAIPREPCFAYPHGIVLRRLVTPHLPALADRYADRSFPARFLIAEGALGDADLRAMLETLVTLGARVRVRADIPAWTYVERGVAASLAAGSGSAIPDAATTVYDRDVVDLVAALYEEWWSDARPLDTGEELWRPVLRQLADGRSDEQAAAVLGLSLRTVRRRIAEAMSALDARSRFELGVAWAALEHGR